MEMLLKRSSFLIKMNWFITFIYLLFFVAPFSLLLHELGHVVGARIIHANNIIVHIGIGKKVAEVKVIRVTFIIRPLFFLHFKTETKRHEALTKKEAIIVALMGPLFNIGLSFVLVICYNLIITHPAIYLLLLFNIWLALVNLIPFKIGRKYSDGYVIIQELVK